MSLAKRISNGPSSGDGERDKEWGSVCLADIPTTWQAYKGSRETQTECITKETPYVLRTCWPGDSSIHSQLRGGASPRASASLLFSPLALQLPRPPILIELLEHRSHLIPIFGRRLSRPSSYERIPRSSLIGLLVYPDRFARIGSLDPQGFAAEDTI